MDAASAARSEAVKPDSPSRSEALSARHLTALDGLRGLAILLVVIYHFGLLHANFHDGANPLAQFAQIGWIGVDLFFVLSGFLITGILLDSREAAHYFRNFLARRFLRIWPLYYLNLALFFFVAPVLLASPPAELVSMQHEQAWFWLYAANWMFALQGGFQQTSGGYFWSLAVEEQFYLLWPFIVYCLSAGALRRLCLALFAISIAARVVLVAYGVSTNAAYTMTFSHMDGLAIGAFLAATLRSPGTEAAVDRWLPRAALAGIAGLVIVRWFDGALLFWGKAMVTAGIACGALLFGYLLWSHVRREHVPVTSRFFANRFMVATGRYSYALYLTHVPVSFVVFEFASRVTTVTSGAGYWAAFAAAFAISWALAFASWHVFEKHILKLKRFFV